MSRHPFRRLFAILFAIAFLSAPARIMPVAAMPVAMDMTASAALRGAYNDALETP